MRPIRLLFPLLALFTLAAFAQETALLEDPEEGLEQAQAKLKGYEKAESEEDKRWKQAVEQRIAILQKLIATRKSSDSLDDETIEPEALAARKSAAQAVLDASRDRKEPEWVPLTSLDEVAKFEEPFKEAQSERDARLAARENTDSRIKSATEDLEKLSKAETEARKRLEALTGSDELSSYRKVSTKVEMKMIAERNSMQKRTVKLLGEMLPALQVELDAARAEFKQAEMRLELARMVEALLIYGEC